MTGTIINVLAILAGSLAGILLSGKLPEKLRETVIHALGLLTLAMGIQMFLKTQSALLVLGSLLIGAIIGEALGIEDGIQRLGKFLQKTFMRGGETANHSGFVHAFLTASLLFCIGPVAILGSIQDGLTGDFQLLVVKSIMDGFASVAFAASLGVGVAFSALPILVYQGSISMLASQAEVLITAPMMTEMTAIGGVLLMGIAISNMLELRHMRIGNLLPAIFIGPLLVVVLAWLGISPM